MFSFLFILVKDLLILFSNNWWCVCEIQCYLKLEILCTQVKQLDKYSNTKTKICIQNHNTLHWSQNNHFISFKRSLHQNITFKSFILLPLCHYQNKCTLGRRWRRRRNWSKKKFNVWQSFLHEVQARLDLILNGYHFCAQKVFHSI